MTVFERIKKLANDQGKGVSKVATDLGFSENLFYRWKTSEPKARDLEKVADYFGVSVDYLLGRTESPARTEEGLSEQEQNLLMRFRRGSKNLSDEEKAIYERQAMNLFDYINKTMKDLDEKNKPK
ncbi:helix-turn-helix domain-containing protein [Enterococcus sp. AZ072]|uniref:helix-turn-helix domain-containing protein n=1 Tax=unclassified Enterococcus TaxID=2608891 RepID=UPI003D27F4B5